jgi:1-acyl-sn-glycerol-3-phosphate acyltransferase
VADVRFLEPIPPGTEEGRRRIAELARERIIAAMQ